MFSVLYCFKGSSLLRLQDKDTKLSELESENRKMKVELEEFRTEAAHLKNQQATIRRLEDRTRQLEQQVSISVVLLGSSNYNICAHFVSQ